MLITELYFKAGGYLQCTTNLYSWLDFLSLMPEVVSGFM